MIRAAVRGHIVDKPSKVDIVDFQAIWLRGQDVAARNGHLLLDEWTQRMEKGRWLFLFDLFNFKGDQIRHKIHSFEQSKRFFCTESIKITANMMLDACRKNSFGPIFPLLLLPILAMEWSRPVCLRWDAGSIWLVSPGRVWPTAAG